MEETSVRAAKPQVEEKSRPAHPWNRWEEVRMPVTADEARASVALARLKVDELTTRASIVPEREAALQFAADRWSEILVKMEWALALLEAGETAESVALADMRAKLARERRRYDDLSALVSTEPDVRALVATLQSRLRLAYDTIDDLRVERAAAERSADDLQRQLLDVQRGETSRRDLRQQLHEAAQAVLQMRADLDRQTGWARELMAKDLESGSTIASLRAAATRRDQSVADIRRENTRLKSLPAQCGHAGQLAELQRSKLDAVACETTLRAQSIFVIDTLLVRGEHTRESLALATDLRKSLTPDEAARWQRDGLPKTLADVERCKAMAQFTRRPSPIAGH